MKSFGYGIAAMAFGLLQLAARALVVIGKLAALIAVPLLAACVRKVRAKHRPVRAKRQEIAPISVQIPQDIEKANADTERATIIPTNDFDVADRIVSIRLDPPVGVINLRVYTAPAVVKRDLIVSEPHLRALMKGRRHTLPDVPFDRVGGLEEIKEETIEAVEKLINEVGNRAVRANRPRKDDSVRSRTPVAPAPSPAVKESPRAEQVRPVAVAEATPKADLPMNAVVAPKVMTGFTYVGQLAKAGSQTVRPQGRPPYEVFEATLQLDNGAELALRGAELERELAANSCDVGQRVAITPMGKVPVTLTNGSEGQKNLYKVKRMDAPHKG